MEAAEMIMLGANKRAGWRRSRNGVWNRSTDSPCPICFAKVGQECHQPPEFYGFTHAARPIQWGFGPVSWQQTGRRLGCAGDGVKI